MRMVQRSQHRCFERAAASGIQTYYPDPTALSAIWGALCIAPLAPLMCLLFCTRLVHIKLAPCGRGAAAVRLQHVARP